MTPTISHQSLGRGAAIAHESKPKYQTDRPSKRKEITNIRPDHRQTSIRNRRYLRKNPPTPPFHDTQPRDTAASCELCANPTSQFKNHQAKIVGKWPFLKMERTSKKPQTVNKARNYDLCQKKKGPILPQRMNRTLMATTGTNPTYVPRALPSGRRRAPARSRSAPGRTRNRNGSRQRSFPHRLRRNPCRAGRWRWRCRWRRTPAAWC